MTMLEFMILTSRVEQRKEIRRIVITRQKLETVRQMLLSLRNYEIFLHRTKTVVENNFKLIFISSFSSVIYFNKGENFFIAFFLLNFPFSL